MAVDPQANPLTNEHCAWCNSVLSSAVVTDQLIKACKDCGYEVGDAEATNNAHKAQAEAIKRNFFPMNP